MSNIFGTSVDANSNRVRIIKTTVNIQAITLYHEEFAYLPITYLLLATSTINTRIGGSKTPLTTCEANMM